MKVAGYDTETTGIAYGDHRIIEVAVLTYDLATERLLDRYVQRINPLRSIDAGAQRVHGISLAMLSGEPVWKDVAPQVHRRLAAADLIVAHNGIGFDMPFTNYELARVGLPKLETPVLDTMLEGRFATPNGAVPNLGALCTALGVDYGTGAGKAHAAHYDVEVMMQCFFRGVRWRAFNLPEEIVHAIAA
ncbi:3'-5' exonuclease [Methylobacterium sp. WL103]|uniref:3'-5' exonuclease n=1 Tax=Methylobacterium sp. WL103 TaxID=2603891 RepID=UPI0011C759D7|nr:3'-5' exonuclease [Methylobacterium sp. WL103]TXN08952.1 3'-5' exonuclease [Methylobacterium sp. WL103]